MDVVDHPRFSPAELDRRRIALVDEMTDAGVDSLVVYGADRSGSAVQWLAEWPVTREAALVVTPGRRDALFVQFYNHVPAAQRFATRADVSWGGPSTVESIITELKRRGARRVGTIGPLGWRTHRRLADGFEMVGLDTAYTRLRLIKSPEELAWLRTGAALSDRAIEAVRDGVRPGMKETELGAMCESAYLATGATNHIHYFAVTAMTDPDMCVPSQWPRNREIRVGDIITCEISASWWGYAGQVLRSMTVGAEPTPLYRNLHAAAEAAFDAICAVLRPGARPEEVVKAAMVIEKSAFTTHDDLVHGYGGGYLPPVLGSASRMNEPLPDMVFEEGMTVVVQPNVVTPDETAGVQTGGLVAITRDGVEHLQHTLPGLWRVG